MKARATSSRVGVSVLLAAIVGVGLAGCNFVTPQATLNQYDASDGVSVRVGDVRLLNALVLTEDGEDGNLIGTAVNTGTDDVELRLQYVGDGLQTDLTIELEAGTATDIGYGRDGQFFLPRIGAKPGELLALYVQYGDEPGKEALVPVLDGTLEQYSDLLPTPTPTPTETPDATPTPTVTP